MEDSAISALDSLIGSGTMWTVLALSLIWLIYVVKVLLATKDGVIQDRKTINTETERTKEILRMEKNEDKLKQFDFIHKVTDSLQKIADMIEKNENEEKRYREKVSVELDNIKTNFISLPCKLWKKW